MLKLNETPIRTANNFRINNIEIDAQIPKIIPEFENVQIIKENSEIDEAEADLFIKTAEAFIYTQKSKEMEEE